MILVMTSPAYSAVVIIVAVVAVGGAAVMDGVTLSHRLDPQAEGRHVD